MTTGGYILRMQGAAGARIIDNRNNFSTGTVSTINEDASFCLPIGTDRPIFTSCDKLDWVNNQFIVASLNTDVSDEWQDGLPYSAQDPTSGYEFWFFNPNGGYSFRVFKALNNASGMGTTFSRAAHLLLNNWAAANHIPHNQLMNVRIRGVVNGQPTEWGPACRFKIDPAAAACPKTNLMDIPGNAFLSCGQYRLWATNQAVHARPVAGASQYQFRFVALGEGHDITRTATSYWTRLGFNSATNQPLTNISIWEVSVRAMVNGQWCEWGDMCTLNIGTQSPGTVNMLGNEDVTGLNMWPNPNRGDQVNISISEVPASVTTIAVDMFDLQGRRVMTRTIPTQGGMVKTLMDLQGNLGTGLYMVNITVGEKIFSKRLMIQP
jgi:hypothetical protein